LRGGAFNDDEWPQPTFVVSIDESEHEERPNARATTLTGRPPKDPSAKERRDQERKRQAVAREHREAIEELARMLLDAGWPAPGPNEQLRRLAVGAARMERSEAEETPDDPLIIAVAELRSTALHAGVLVQGVHGDLKTRTDRFTLEEVMSAVRTGREIWELILIAGAVISLIARYRWLLAPIANEATLLLEISGSRLGSTRRLAEATRALNGRPRLARPV